MGLLPLSDLLCGLVEVTSPPDTSVSLLGKHFNFCLVEKSRKENVHVELKELQTRRSQVLARRAKGFVLGVEWYGRRLPTSFFFRLE